MGALRFDGVNDIVTIGSGMTGNVGTSLYTMRIKSGPAGITLPASGLAGFIGTNGVSTSNGLVTNASGQLRVYASGTNRYGSTGQLIFSGVEFDYTLTHLANGNWDIYNNLTGAATGESGTFTQSTSWATGTNTQLNQFGRSSNGNTVYLQGDIDTFEVTGLANAQAWRADLSGGTGQILPTTSGNNQGDLINFPTNDTQWIGFAASISASIDYSVPAPVYSASASATAPGVSSSIDYSVPAPQYSASASATAPGVSASVSYTVPAPQYTASASATAPGFSASVDYSVPAPQYSASASATAPGFSASVSYSVPAPQYAASASATAPGFSASVAYTVPSPQYAVAASATAAGFSAAVAYSVPAPVYSASASATVPVLSASIAYSVPAPQYQVYATPQEQLITVARGANITYTAKSRSLTYTAASRDIRS